MGFVEIQTLLALLFFFAIDVERDEPQKFTYALGLGSFGFASIFACVWILPIAVTWLTLSTPLR